MNVSPARQFYYEMMVKGVKTATKSTDKPEKIEERKQELRYTCTQVIAPEVNGRYAQAQFIGSDPKEGLAPVYVTTIYPSGRYHCECNAFKRTGAQRQNRPCKHATALAKIAYLELR